MALADVIKSQSAAEGASSCSLGSDFAEPSVAMADELDPDMEYVLLNKRLGEVLPLECFEGGMPKSTRPGVPFTMRHQASQSLPAGGTSSSFRVRAQGLGLEGAALCDGPRADYQEAIWRGNVRIAAKGKELSIRRLELASG